MEGFSKELADSPFLTIKQYVGKRVIWEGYFDNAADEDNFFVYPNSNLEGTSIICTVAADSKELLLGLRQGCKVKFDGFLHDKRGVRDCKILLIKPPMSTK